MFIFLVIDLHSCDLIRDNDLIKNTAKPQFFIKEFRIKIYSGNLKKSFTTENL